MVEYMEVPAIYSTKKVAVQEVGTGIFGVLLPEAECAGRFVCLLKDVPACAATGSSIEEAKLSALLSLANHKLPGLVESCSDAGLKVWIEYLWNLRWFCTSGNIQDSLRKFAIWKRFWDEALSIWDARHPKDRNKLWDSITPSKPKRYRFLT